MAGPWEKYAAPTPAAADGPWSKYAAANDGPPADAKPGSKAYADWAVAQARAGKQLPMVSSHDMTAPQPDKWNSLSDKAQAAAASWIEGAPVIGGPWMDAATKLRAMIQGIPEDRVRAETAKLQADNPITSGASGLASGIATLAPLGMTAAGGKLLGMTGSFGSRLGFGIASGGALSGADALTRGATPEEAGKAALAGGALGAVFPLAGAAFRKVVSPVAKAGADAASKLLAKEGVDLTAGQITGSKGLRFREAELGGNTAAAFMEKQAQQFTAAALKRAGINATEASHDVLDGAFTQIGQQFDDLAARNFIQPDQKLATDLQAAWRRFEGSTNPQTRPKVVERLIADIYGSGNGKRMTGEWYKSTRSELGRLSKSQNPELAEAARDLQFALDDAMERTMKVTNPADAGAWKAVRGQYKNLLVIEDAATRAGAQSADGIITPQALRSAAIRQNKRAFARGRNDFTDLADAGVSKMVPLPDSGTAGRLSAKAVLPLGAATGAGIGGTVGNIPGAVIGGLAGAAVPWALGKAALSKAGRAYLSNGALAGGKALPALPPAVLPLELTKKRKPVEITIGTRGL